MSSIRQERSIPVCCDLHRLLQSAAPIHDEQRQFWRSKRIQDVNFDENVIRQVTLATLRMHNSEACEVSVLLTNDTTIQFLNRQYRNIDNPTDVLAFAMREGCDKSMNPLLLGDLVISVLSLIHI